MSLGIFYFLSVLTSFRFLITGEVFTECRYPQVHVPGFPYHFLTMGRLIFALAKLHTAKRSLSCLQKTRWDYYQDRSQQGSKLKNIRRQIILIESV